MAWNKISGMGAHKGEPPPAGVGFYTVSEAVALIRFRLAGKVNNKLFLRISRGRKELTRRYDAIIGPPLRLDGEYLFMFEQLIELITIVALTAKGVKYSTIRDAHRRGEEKYGDRPFAREGFRTDGVRLFTPADSNEPEELSRQQTYFQNVIEPTLQLVIPILNDVSYLNSRAVQFSPLGQNKTVVLNPRVAFGAPIDRNSGIRTAVLYAMMNAVDDDEDVSDWYGVSVAAVRDAVELEDALRKAA